MKKGRRLPGQAPNYTYTLKTNEPGAGITYKDATKSGKTVTTEGDPKTLPFNTVDPMGLSSDTISIEKVWENELDGRNAGNNPITFTVKADNDVFGTVSLGPDTWKVDNYNISAGLMKTIGGQVVYEHGHDFTIVEPDNLAYYWDFKADIYHPMVIDNELVMLLKVDTAAESDYTIDGKYYKRSTHGATLKATNERRSYLNLSKEVVDQKGDSYNTDQAFTFTASITESRNEDVWFAVYDYNLPAPAPGQPDTRAIKDGTLVTRNDGEAIHYQDSDGFYSVPSGTEITITLKKGWNIRFINLHTGSSYTISESSSDPVGFGFKEAVATATNGGTTGTVSDRTTTGSIDKSNTDYTVAYTNQAITQNVSIWKTDMAHNALSGAAFDLYTSANYDDAAGKPKDGAVPVVQGTTGANGILTLGDLAVGDYRLVETHAPAGYNHAESAIEITVFENNVTAMQGSMLSEVARNVEGNRYRQYWVTGQDENTWQIRVWNNPGVALPSTGGYGSYIHYAVGTLLLTFAAFVYLRRRRHGEIV